jgi:hypothetical protein
VNPDRAPLEPDAATHRQVGGLGNKNTPNGSTRTANET